MVGYLTSAFEDGIEGVSDRALALASDQASWASVLAYDSHRNQKVVGIAGEGKVSGGSSGSTIPGHSPIAPPQVCLPYPYHDLFLHYQPSLQ
jgi:hypothetical protein